MLIYKMLYKIVRGMRLAALISSGGSVPKAFIPLRGMGHFSLSAYESGARTSMKLRPSLHLVRKVRFAPLHYQTKMPSGLRPEGICARDEISCADLFRGLCTQSLHPASRDGAFQFVRL